MIDAMETFKGISNSSRASDVIRILDYTAEFTLPMPEQQMFSFSKPTLKPITFTSKELLRGHQDFEQYAKGNSRARFRNNARYITAEYVETYSQEISKYIKAALVLDTDDEVIYILLYVDGTEVFRQKYTEVYYKWYVKEGSERLSVYSLKCKRFSDAEVDKMNREGWNGNLNAVGDFAEHLGLSIAGGLGHPAAVKIGMAVEKGGQALKAFAHTFDLSKDSIESGDFIFYYGTSNKTCGGLFSGKTLKRKQ